MSAGSSSHRLPIDHPDYRYPPSRNPYWQKIKTLAGRILSDNDTETHAGHWREHFPRSIEKSERRPLHVEVGCNAGHVVVEWAARDPKSDYIGLDWKFKPIFRGAEKGVKKKLDNLLFFRAHAERLPYMFGPEEVDFLYLYFPDPWAKKSQLKNRFLTAERLRALHPIVRRGGVFHLKTDHAGYFEWMVEAIEQVRDLWEPTELTRNLHEKHPAPLELQIPEVTLFERLFIKDGLPIHSVKLVRR